MNSFYIPALAGQIYAMPGMETKLHAVINQPGDYEGFSANYSGAGFSGMRFKFHGLSRADFDALGAEGQGRRQAARAATATCSSSARASASRCAATARVAPDLYDAIVNLCVEPGKMCMKRHDGDRRAGRRRPRRRITPLAIDDRAARRTAAPRRCARSPPRSAPSTTRPAAPHGRPADRSSNPIRSRCPTIPISTKLIFGRLTLGGDSLPRADPARAPSSRSSLGGIALARRASPISASGARCGATGSPASTTRRSASCT